MWIYIFIIITILIICYIFILYNSLVKLENKVNEAFSTMDVYLKKRWDLIPNIVKVVKSYAKHEKETLKEVIELRNSSYDELSNDEKINTNKVLDNGINKIIALAENYPDLKANENFKDLTNQLIKIEDEIANSRKFYNGVVRIFNNKVEMFPNNIFTKFLGYKSKVMFKANEEERKNIKISL